MSRAEFAVDLRQITSTEKDPTMTTVEPAGLSAAFFGTDAPPLTDQEFGRLWALSAKRRVGAEMTAIEQAEFASVDGVAMKWASAQK